MRKTHTSKLFLPLLTLTVLLAVMLAYWTLNLGNYFSIDSIRSQQTAFAQYSDAYPIRTLAAFFGIYVVSTAFSIPGAAGLTLLAGALFGFFTGLALVSFASSIGATLAFLVSRFLLRDWIQNQFRDKLNAVNRGIEQEGAYYLFTLRLVPIIPFFLVNLIMGLTPIRPWTYYWVSQLGMLLGTAVYVNAGTQLAAIKSTRDILTGGPLAGLIAIGLLPLVSKRLLAAHSRRQRTRSQQGQGNS